MIFSTVHMGGSRGGYRWSRPPPPPPKNHKSIGFPCIIDPDPYKSQNYQASIQWWAMMALFSGILIVSPPQQKKKHVVSVGLPLTKLSASTTWFTKWKIVATVK